MRRPVLIAAVALALSLARFVLAPFLGQLADLIIIVPPFWFWLKGSRAPAVGVLLVSCLISDAVLPTRYPLYTLASLLAGAVHIIALEPMLSADNTLTRTIAIAVWLILWRLAYAVMLLAASVWQSGMLTPNLSSVAQVAGWLLGGMLVWAVFELAYAMRSSFRRTSHG